jgi:hypothetical protein
MKLKWKEILIRAGDEAVLAGGIFIGLFVFNRESVLVYFMCSIILGLLLRTLYRKSLYEIGRAQASKKE